MSKSPNQDALLRSIDDNTRIVLAKMDEYENLGFNQNPDVSEQMLGLFARVSEKIDTVAERLASESTDPAQKERHAETLLLILSFSPSAATHWFYSELPYRRPDIYAYLYDRVQRQKPLKMHGKLIAERIMCFQARTQILDHIFRPETTLALQLALEACQRQPSRQRPDYQPLVSQTTPENAS